MKVGTHMGTGRHLMTSLICMLIQIPEKGQQENEQHKITLLADLKNQPIVSSCVTHILPFCGYFKGQEVICFNPTSWHLVTYNFL